jgi:hypothetical protein
VSAVAEREVTVGVVKETAPGERRVALVPDTVQGLCAAGRPVLVESGAGAGARWSDADYSEAGARVVAGDELAGACDILLAVHRPASEVLRKLDEGAVVAGLSAMQDDAGLLTDLAAAGVRVLDLTRLPRTLSRAQSMDALSSQANVAGYKAAVLAAEAYDRYFPLLMTAAGVARPARLLVLGAGVAGLQSALPRHMHRLGRLGQLTETVRLLLTSATRSCPRSDVVDRGQLPTVLQPGDLRCLPPEPGGQVFAGQAGLRAVRLDGIARVRSRAYVHWTSLLSNVGGYTTLVRLRASFALMRDCVS